MNLQDLLGNTTLLEVIKVLIFVFGFVFSSSYLIPRGIHFLAQWKETKQRSKLSSGINSIAGGVFILLYLLTVFIADTIKKMYS
jgi:hypothetical protein